ncbi:hypothetical protein [Halobacteriovorax marinus]|uniref:hypothetical protein n=1 Tax=Halobacteriovorax marinus TaxID=97084 RepID=UPI003A921791
MKFTMVLLFLTLSTVIETQADDEFANLLESVRNEQRLESVSSHHISFVLEQYEEYMFNNFNLKVDINEIENIVERNGLYRGIVAPSIFNLDTALAMKNKSLANAYLSIVSALSPHLGRHLSQKLNLSGELFRFERQDFEEREYRRNEFSIHEEGISGNILSKTDFSSEVRGGAENSRETKIDLAVGPLFRNAREKNDYSVRDIGESCVSGCTQGTGAGIVAGGVIGAVGGGLATGGSGIVPSAIAGAKVGRDFACLAGCIGNVVKDLINADEPEEVAPITEDVPEVENEPEENEDPVSEDDEDEEDDRVINPDLYGSNRVANPEIFGVSRVINSDLNGNNDSALLMLGIEQLSEKPAEGLRSMNPSLVNFGSRI